MESHSVFGTLWSGLGMGAYYMALLWINLLLGVFLTPLFLIPGTWLLDVVYRRRREAAVAPRATDHGRTRYHGSCARAGGRRASARRPVFRPRSSPSP